MGKAKKSQGQGVSRVKKQWDQPNIVELDIRQTELGGTPIADAPGNASS